MLVEMGERHLARKEDGPRAGAGTGKTYAQDNGFAEPPRAESSVRMAGGEKGVRLQRPPVPGPLSPTVHSPVLRRLKGLWQRFLRRSLTGATQG